MSAFTIDELMTILEEHPGKTVPWTPLRFHSWRGRYDCLGMGVGNEPSTTDVLRDFLSDCLGEIVYGHKGGEYVLTESSEVHFSEDESQLGQPFDEGTLSEILSEPVSRDRPVKELVDWAASDPALFDLKCQWLAASSKLPPGDIQEWARGMPVGPETRDALRVACFRLPGDRSFHLAALMIDRPDDSELQHVLGDIIRWDHGSFSLAKFVEKILGEPT